MEESKFQLSLGGARRGAKEGYLMLFFSSRNELGNIIKEWRDWTDPRIRIYTKFLITSITDDDIRADIMKKLNDNLAKIELKKITNEEKAKESLDVCIDILGDITAFYDEFLGVSHTLRVGSE